MTIPGSTGDAGAGTTAISLRGIPEGSCWTLGVGDEWLVGGFITLWLCQNSY